MLVNRTRASVIGIDPQRQVRRTLERYAGVRRMWFAPFDPRNADAALLRAEPVPVAARRSALAGALRTFAREAVGAERSRGRRGTSAR